MRWLIVAATVILFDAQSVAADRQITEAQSNVLARALVEAVYPLALKTPGFGFDGSPPNPKYPHIEFFTAWGSTGQGMIGAWALDLYTGDGWDLTECSEITSPKLEKLQRKIRREIGLTDRRYKQIRAVAPPCQG